MSAQPTGLTPSTINGSSVDDPIATNVTFTYTGPVVHANGSEIVFSGFQIISTQDSTTEGNFSSQATKDTLDANAATDQVAGRVTVPAAVPEPGTLLLFGGGIAGLVTFGRTKRD